MESFGTPEVQSNYIFDGLNLRPFVIFFLISILVVLTFVLFFMINLIFEKVVGDNTGDGLLPSLLDGVSMIFGYSRLTLLGEYLSGVDLKASVSDIRCYWAC